MSPLSVIIPTFNRCELLKRTLPSVLSQDFLPDAYEVIVVVDGSNDGTLDFLHKQKPLCSLRVVEQPNRGQTEALNTGIRVANGEVVLFLDDDLVCDKALVREHAAAHTRGIPQIVFGSMHVAGDSPDVLAAKSMSASLHKYFARLDKDKKPKWPYDAWVGPNCSIPRSVLLELGGYDQTLFPKRYEDVDLGLRLWKRGIPFKYHPSAVTYHVCAKPKQSISSDITYDGEGLIRLCKKHPDYRPYAGVAEFMRGSLLRRFAMKSAASIPLLEGKALTALLTLSEGLAHLPGFKVIGSKMASVGSGIGLLRGAVQEVGSWKNLRKAFGQELPVLLYHRVGSPTSQTPCSSLTIPPKQFERQINWLLRRGYVGIRPTDWLRWSREGVGLPAKPILITFDDAYAEIAEHALPVLQRCGYGAAVFVITKKIGQLTDWDGRPMMTSEQIRYWKDRGIEFGAHTRSHPDLTTLSSSELMDEVIGGGEELARILGHRVKSFAYPYGSFNPVVQDAVKNTYDLAFSCEEGLNDIRSDPHLLRRTMVQPGDSLLDIECHLRFGYSPVMRLRARLRIRSRVKKAMRLLNLAPR